MYLYLRVARVLAGALVKPGLGLDDASELRLRVWPSDLDTYPEMNNGRYWTIRQIFGVEKAIMHFKRFET